MSSNEKFNSVSLEASTAKKRITHYENKDPKGRFGIEMVSNLDDSEIAIEQSKGVSVNCCCCVIISTGAANKREK
ncbi:hypothetical protein [Lactobacillus corticis]|uniref:Uncharacterized protein n=1 Tax=Lactobacillus corticis TaxID=2201249 RepID=A0A916QFT3_9LACO|nr:hypothetical protein [Lactobacillus corticis]GFZ26509.1 hypothetical protein LCB40_03890 [Lactobacillus corticis]